MVNLFPTGAKLAFNISPAHLADDDFCQDVSRLLQQLNTDIFTPVFEITERGMVQKSWP